MHARALGNEAPMKISYALLDETTPWLEIDTLSQASSSLVMRWLPLLYFLSLSRHPLLKE